ncbi:hypothetical protein H310_00521 [Aphanomyces invadans]|uniref:Cilia- and flagella-associated protein 57 n=1 Tax=Aphanomyces invadans TaxID=157072 RepID=A0A024UUE9_9STRA|nr:hypothetical protein H310_00521 [Aphanomyces invadans]ETW10151.1 hypothetical protein H310_00521 [Aphanomyces invadans]|eukprot:XP_008861562.1 hypothetical protein H310_00521 [Aphanomyces invadans]
MVKASHAHGDSSSTMQAMRSAIKAAATYSVDSHAGKGATHNDGATQPQPIRVTPASGVGFNTNLRDMLLYVNKNEVIYAIGKYVALQNIHSQKTSFFEPPASKDSDSASIRLGDICALAITAKRSYVAVARSAHSSLRRTESTISMYCLKTAKEDTAGDPTRWSRLTPIRTLTYATHSFTSVAFSHDSKYIVAQSTTSEWVFALWDWTRARQVALTEAHSKVTRICFNPIDVAQISTSGGVHLRLWRLTEPTCRPFATFNSANSAVRYVDHTWVGATDGIVAVLDNGDVQYFRNGELVRTIPSLHHGHILQCVQSFRTRCVVVGGDCGWLSVLEVDSFNGADIHLVKRMRLDSKEAVLGLSMDAAGAGFMCATPSYYGAYDLSNLCLLREDDEFVSLMTFTPLPRLGSVTTMATSSRKHVVAVTGKRATGATLACIYGQSDTRGVLHHAFVHVVPNCMDFHPSGFEMVISFSAQIHIYHVLYDSLRLAFEVDIKHATTVAYSCGGNYFVALVDDKSVYVYRNFGGLEPALVAVCAGREANVVCLRWGLDDGRFYTSDDCGALLEWGLGADGSFSATQATSSGQKSCLFDRATVFSALALSRNPVTSCPIIAASCVSDTDVSVVVVWRDGCLNSTPLESMEIQARITVLEFGPACVVCAGTANGSVVVFSWYGLESTGGPSTLSASPIWFDLSMASILSVRSCMNERVLLVASVDGTMMSCHVDVHAPSPRFLAGPETLPGHTKTLHMLQAAPETQFSTALVTDELCLVDRASVVERSLRITDLETEKEQLKMEKDITAKLNADQMNLLDRERQTELRLAKSSWETKMKALETDMHTKAHDAHTAMLEMKCEHDKSLQTMQSIFATKLSAMTDVCQQLERQVVTERQRVDDIRFGGEEKVMVLTKEWDAKLAATVATYEAKLATLAQQLEAKQNAFDELLSQQNDDSLIHLSAMQAAVDQGKAAQAQHQEETKSTISSLQQQLRMMLNALATKDERIKQATLEANRLHLVVDALNNELSVERKTTAKAVADGAALEARVADQARQIQGLEEMNNARLCKLKTMQATISNKELDIQHMRTFVEELHAENSAVVEDANEMDEAHGQMKRKVSFFERSVADLKRQVAEAKAVTTAFCRDLGILIEREQEGTRVTIDDIVKMYHKYDVRSGSQRNRVVQREMASDEVIIQELTRQNKCGEDQQRKLRTRLDAMTHERQKLVSVFSTDNTKLLQELNAMAKRNHELQLRNGVLEAEAKRHRSGRGTMKASQSTPELETPPENNTDSSNQADSATTIVVTTDHEPRIYIPCGVNVGAVPRASKDLTPLKHLQRPQSGIPKVPKRQTSSPSQPPKKSKPRPQSAHPTKS